MTEQHFQKQQKNTPTLTLPRRGGGEINRNALILKPSPLAGEGWVGGRVPFGAQENVVERIKPDSSGLEPGIHGGRFCG